MNKEVGEYFPPYKDCAFRVDYDVNNGEESYFLNCIRENYIWDINSPSLDIEYNQFKKRIDDGRINWQ